MITLHFKSVPFTMEENTWLDKISRLTLLPEIYKDLAQPGVQKVGIALGDAIEFALLPTRFMRHGTEWISVHLNHQMNKIRERIDEIPNEKLIEVIPELAVPVLQKLAYTSNEQIAEMFINLLVVA